MFFFKKIYWRVIGLTFLPLIALGGTEACDTSGKLFANPLCKTGDLSTLIENLAKYATQIGATIAVVMIIYSGFLFVKAQGKAKELDEAKATFKWTVIGTGILLGAWVIATAIKELIEGLK